METRPPEGLSRQVRKAAGRASPSPGGLLGAILLLVLSFGLLVVLVRQIDRLGTEDTILEERLVGALISLGREGAGAMERIASDMDEVAGPLRNRAALTTMAGRREGALRLVAEWEALRSLSSGNRAAVVHGDLEIAGFRRGGDDALRARTAESLALAIQEYLPRLREQRADITASLGILFLIAAFGILLVVVYLFVIWSGLRMARLASDWSRRSLHRALEAEEAERRRIARELHDDAAQDIQAARMLCERAAAQADADLARARAAEAAALLKGTGQKLRHLATELRPPGLDEGGLVAALHGLCERSRRIGLGEATVLSLGTIPEPDLATAIQAYRIVQESLGNAFKHAPGRPVELRLEACEEGGKPGLMIAARNEIPDNGTPGPASPARTGGSGLGIMAERAKLVGGRFSLELAGGEARMRLFVPCPARVEAKTGERAREG